MPAGLIDRIAEVRELRALVAGGLPDPAVALVGGAPADQEAVISFDGGRDDADRHGSVRGVDDGWCKVVRRVQVGTESSKRAAAVCGGSKLACQVV